MNVVQIRPATATHAVASETPSWKPEIVAEYNALKAVFIERVLADAEERFRGSA